MTSSEIFQLQFFSSVLAKNVLRCLEALSCIYICENPVKYARDNDLGTVIYKYS
jgi:hypothetical protein